MRSILFDAFVFVGGIVLLSLLVAILSDTYDRVKLKEKAELTKCRALMAGWLLFTRSIPAGDKWVTSSASFSSVTVFQEHRLLAVQVALAVQPLLLCVPFFSATGPVSEQQEVLPLSSPERRTERRRGQTMEREDPGSQKLYERVVGEVRRPTGESREKDGPIAPKTGIVQTIPSELFKLLTARMTPFCFVSLFFPYLVVYCLL